MSEYDKSCQYSRPELEKLLADSGYGSNAMMFSMYFRPNPEGSGAPLCATCGNQIGMHSAPAAVGIPVLPVSPPPHFHVSPDGALSGHQQQSHELWIALCIIVAVILVNILVMVAMVGFQIQQIAVIAFVAVMGLFVLGFSSRANAMWDYRTTYLPATGILTVDSRRMFGTCCHVSVAMPLKSIRRVYATFPVSKYHQGVVVAHTANGELHAIGRHPERCIACSDAPLVEEVAFWVRFINFHGGECVNGGVISECCPVCLD